MHYELTDFKTSKDHPRTHRTVQPRKRDSYLKRIVFHTKLWEYKGPLSQEVSSCLLAYHTHRVVLLLMKFYGMANHSSIFSQIVSASPFHSSLLSRTHSSQSPNSIQSISQIFCNASIGALTPPVVSDNAGPMTEVIQCSAIASVHGM